MDRYVAAAALTCAAICSAACAARAGKASAIPPQFRQDLTLSLVVPSVAIVGEETALRLRVRNSGQARIDACIGPARNIRLLPENDTEGNEPVIVSERVVDRPGCQKRFQIGPGAQFEWNETTKLPGIVAGPASLEVDVQIVDPAHCQPDLGCPATMVTARASVEIRRRSSG